MSIRQVFSKVYIPIKYQLFKVLPKSAYPALIKLCARVELHETINLHNPATINDKVQWLKLFDRRNIKSKLADKYSVREWVEEKAGSDLLIPLLGVWDKFEDIDFDHLPDKFVLKAVHGCGCNYIVTDKTALNVEDARRKFAKWCKTNYAYYTGELQYEHIKPRIIAEEYLENDGGELFDYKVFCFNGQAKYIMFLNDRHTSLKMAFYDRNWVKQPFTYSYPQIEEDIERPECLTCMLETAEKLAYGFDMVRVDFYILNDGTLKFGEMTFASAGGFSKWNPPEYNRILGEKIIIHPNGGVLSK